MCVCVCGQEVLTFGLRAFGLSWCRVQRLAVCELLVYRFLRVYFSSVDETLVDEI